MAKPIFIEISDEPIEPGISWTDKKTGQPKTGPAKQRAYLHGGGMYPLPFKIPVDDAGGPHRPGRYMFAGECFKVGDFDGLDFLDRRYKIIPLDEAIRELTGGDAKGGKPLATAA